jgi:hypothetical protein
VQHVGKRIEATLTCETKCQGVVDEGTKTTVSEHLLMTHEVAVSHMTPTRVRHRTSNPPIEPSEDFAFVLLGMLLSSIRVHAWTLRSSYPAVEPNRLPLSLALPIVVPTKPPQLCGILSITRNPTRPKALIFIGLVLASP